MDLDVLDKQQIFWQLYQTELLVLLMDLEFGMQVFFTDLSLTEFQVRYLALQLLFSSIDGFEWFWMGSLHMNIQLMLEFLKVLFFVVHFSYYTLMTFLMMLSLILLSVLMLLLSILSVIRHPIFGNNWIDFWTWIWSTRHGELGQEMVCSFQCWKNAIGFVWPA